MEQEFIRAKEVVSKGDADEPRQDSTFRHTETYIRQQVKALSLT